ncbi:hypothetical protein AAFA46_07820 [Oscillospiraceae bacterium WX1]
MSPASTAGKPGKLGDKEFEEAFKPGAKDVPPDKVLKAKKKSPLITVVIVLIILVLMAGGVAGLYLTGNMNPLLQAVGLGSLVDTSQGDRAAALDAREAALNTREQALNDLQKQLDDQAAQSSAQPSTSPSGSGGQTTTTTTSAQTLEELLTGLSTEKLTELQQVGSIYSKMDAVSAGAIMTKVYDAQQIAVIVYYMQPAAAALLLSKLDPQLAADVTKILAS